MDYYSDLSEDDDDDDVRDGSEVMGIFKKKESTSSGNAHSNSKTSHSSHKHEDRPKKYSKSAVNIVDSVERRSHSNAITSPTVETGPKPPPADSTHQSEELNFSPPSNNHSPTKPPIPPKSHPSPTREALTKNRSSPGDKRPSELSL